MPKPEVEYHLRKIEEAKADAAKLCAQGFPEAARIALVRAQFHRDFAKIEASNDPLR